ncbi:MAG: ribonuclease HII [Candidatus Paceibacterota bacterium]|jgi:ribonuclease HII
MENTGPKIIWLDKYSSLVGIDEAGRGPLAGPVAVGVVKFLADRREELETALADFPVGKDSKKMTVKMREHWYTKLRELKEIGVLDFAVAFSSHQCIDDFGIAPAVRRAMAEGIEKVGVSYEALILLDGSLKAPALYQHQKAIIKGDEKEIVIGLASIAAKVSRDFYMKKIAPKYPEYDLAKHKGYGTSAHCEAIKKYGPSAIHRRSFLKRIWDDKKESV